MGESLKLLCILAHPDDESLGLGGTLAKYGREGVETFVVTATRGEQGRDRTSPERPLPEALGRMREQEARAAGAILGVRGMWFLGCPDGGLDWVEPMGVVNTIADLVRNIQPQVVITMPPSGCDGHPDHVAISQLASAAVYRAAESSRAGTACSPHVVSKLYYFVMTSSLWDAYRTTFGTPLISVDGVERRAQPWPDWAVTTVIDASDCWRTVWDAVQCHRTQIAGRAGIAGLTEKDHRLLWGTQRFCRVFSHVNGGRDRETDLFEGLR